MFCYQKQSFNKPRAYFISIQHIFLDVNLLSQIGLCIYRDDESCEIILHKDFPNLHSHHQQLNVYLHTPELLGLFLTYWQKLLLHEGNFARYLWWAVYVSSTCHLTFLVVVLHMQKFILFTKYRNLFLLLLRVLCLKKKAI